MSKRSAAGGEITQAEKMIRTLPKIVKTGDLVADQAEQGSRDKLERIIREVMSDSGAIESVDTHLDQRRKARELAEKQADMLPPCFCSGRLKDDLKVRLLIKDSDMASADILSAKKKDSEADKQMLVYKYGIGLGFRLGESFRYWQVLDKVFTPRAESWGNRMQHFKQRFVQPDGSIDWKGATFQCLYSPQHALQSVKHVATGDVVNCPAWAAHITTDYDIIMGWDDLQASFERKPMPALPIWNFFQQENKQKAKDDPKGPFKLVQMKGDKIKQFYALADAEKESYLSGVKAAKQAVVASTGGTEADEDLAIKRAVQEYKAEKNQETARAGQLKIAASLEAKARKRRILNRTASQEEADAAAVDASEEEK